MGEHKNEHVDRFIRKAADIASSFAIGNDEKTAKAFWDAYVAVNAAGATIGLPRDELPAVRPSPVAIDEFLTRVVAEGSERGGELVL